MSEVQSKVVEIIVDKLGVKESEVTPEASFTNHLGADSLDTVELIMEFEKAFDIQIPDEDAEDRYRWRRYLLYRGTQEIIYDFSNRQTLKP